MRKFFLAIKNKYILQILLFLILFTCWSVYKNSQKQTLCDTVTQLLNAEKYEEAVHVLGKCIEKNVSTKQLKTIHNQLFQEIISDATQLDPSLHENPVALSQALLFIKTVLPSFIAHSQYYLPPQETGLAYAVEYDPETKNAFIHLHQIIGEGHEKIVTKSVLCTSRPCIVARAKQEDNQDNEIEITNLLKGSPGIFEVIACTRHTENNIPYTTVFSRLYQSGSLQDLFDKKTDLTFSEKLSIAHKIATGITSLHEKRIAHRDLGARNYFVTIEENNHVRSFDVAIADLGRAQYIANLYKKNPQGNFGYAPPEAVFLEKMKGSDYLASDIFAIGCVFYQLFYEKRTEWHKKYYAKNPTNPEQVYQEFVTLLEKSLLPRRSELTNISLERSLTPTEQFENLILQMLEVCPEKRPTATELKQKIEAITRNSS